MTDVAPTASPTADAAPDAPPAPAGSPPPCDRCGAPAVEHLAYAGSHLCGAHLRELVERRVKREVREQGPIEEGVLAVATSGGKDSLVCLKLLHDVFGRRPDVELVAVTVDEGIAAYRAPGVEAAAELCGALDVRHVVRAFADEPRIDVTMDHLVSSDDADLDGAPCSTCGVLRRRLLDAAARDVGADWLATGHNLDDVAQSVLMNVCRGDVDRFARMAPHTRGDGSPSSGRNDSGGSNSGGSNGSGGRGAGDLVPRVLPLRRVPEREVALYAHLSGLPVQQEACPHCGQALRGEFRDILHRLEAGHPGTRHALLAFFDRVRPALEEVLAEEARKEGAADGARGVPRCPECGGPSSGGPCRACEVLAAVDGGSSVPAGH